MTKSTLIFSLLTLVFACGKTGEDDPNPGMPGNSSNPNPGSSTLGPGQPGVVGLAGVAAWDALNATEKARIKGWNSLFLHQSVGQDLEEGCKANGFPFEYFGKGGQTNGGTEGRGLRGGIFVDVGGIPNGNPSEKIRVFREVALANKASLQVVVFKFGYADIGDDTYQRVQTEYKKWADDLRAAIPGLRFVHVTPPLVYSTAAFEGNAAKQKVGQWMKDTFKSTDVVFDLQALEANDGACQQANVWRICPENRNSASDPSDVNGVDSSDGQGHLGKKAAKRISKALLMSIYNAGK